MLKKNTRKPARRSTVGTRRHRPSTPEVARPALKPEAIDAIAHYLRGDFDFIPTSDAILDDVRKQLDQLTQSQRIVLDVLHDSARVLVDGGAGTGKTLLAIEAAQRMARARGCTPC